MNRHSFLSSIGAAAAIAFLKEVALADSVLGARPMTPLVETLLPLGSPAFSNVTGAIVCERIESLYHLGESPAFVASLAAFMDPTLFPKYDAALFAAEQSVDPESNPTNMQIADARAYRLAGLPNEDDFAHFTDRQRAVYVRLWPHSAFNTRRRFYQAVRFLTYAAFYSLPEVWPAIGYAGPLLQVTH